MVVEVIRGAGKWAKIVGKAARKFTAIEGRTLQVDRERRFGRVFETFDASIKAKHEMTFIIDIASFQLPQKSNNLVPFWLPKNTGKLH